MLRHMGDAADIADRSNAGYDFTIEFRGFALFAK